MICKSLFKVLHTSSSSFTMFLSTLLQINDAVLNAVNCLCAHEHRVSRSIMGNSYMQLTAAVTRCAFFYSFLSVRIEFHFLFLNLPTQSSNERQHAYDRHKYWLNYYLIFESAGNLILGIIASRCYSEQ